MNEIDQREKISVRVDDLLEENGWETLREVELDHRSDFNRSTVVRWRLYPHEVYRISMYAVYKFLRSLGYSHAQVCNLKFSDVFDFSEYKSLYDGR